MKRKQPEDVVWAADTVGVVKFRLTILQRVMEAVGMLLGPALSFFVLWLAGDSINFVSNLHFLRDMSIIVLLFELAPPNFSITLSPHMAQVRNLRRRTIYWSDVQAIRIVKKRLSNRTIVIYEANGRQTQLRAPVTGFLLWDRRFEEKFHVIGQWWLDFRGPEWQAGFEPWSARPIQEAAGRNAGRLR